MTWLCLGCYFSFPLFCVSVTTEFAHAQKGDSHTMAERHRRRVLAADRSPSEETANVQRGATADTVLVKLLAAAFYGVSSFLIVVVNKSVLTNYR